LVVLSGAIIVRLIAHSWTDDLGFDEALIGQVVDSLVGRREYAFYGGASGTGPVPFSPGISTGAPVIIPAAVIWFITQGSLWTLRIVAIAWIVALLTGWWRLSAGRSTALPTFGLLVAALGMAGDRISTGHMLGEIPATAMIVWALVLHGRSRRTFAYLLLGLAVLTKISMAPVVVALGLAFMFCPAKGERVRDRLGDWRRLARVPAFALLPVLLFETWKVVSLGGVSGYRRWFDEFRFFVSSQNINTYSSWRAGGLLDSKLDSIRAILTNGLIVSVVVLVVARLVAWIWRWESDASPNHEVTGSQEEKDALAGLAATLPLVAVVVGSVGLLGTWILQSKLADPRQPLPGILLLLTGVVALLTGRSRSGGNNGWLTGGAFGIAAVLVMLPTALGDWPDDLDMLHPDQRFVIEAIDRGDYTTIFADGFYENPEIQLAASIPAVPWLLPEGQLVVLGAAQAQFLYGSWESGEARYCAAEATRLRTLTMCDSKDPDYATLGDFTVIDWGEKDAVLGVVSNEGIYGFGGIWTILEPEDPLALRALRLYVNDEPVGLGDIEPDGRVVTWSIPRYVYRTPGRYVLEYRNMVTGDVIPVGEFTL
jgi:hypothetical protein